MKNAIRCVLHDDCAGRLNRDVGQIFSRSRSWTLPNTIIQLPRIAKVTFLQHAIKISGVTDSIRDESFPNLTIQCTPSN